MIALYTFLIPNAIIVYRYIENKYGLVFAGKIPLVIVILFGLAYLAYLYFMKLGWKNILYMIPSGIIVLIIYFSVSNPNKHIHIPEYVLLAWLVFAALSNDHRGKGIFILIFVCTSMLGVVDELEQGIHPGRSYGLSDMMVNSASALIGVFTILGLKKVNATDWKWINDLKLYRGLIFVILFGFIGAVLMCIQLFTVQAQEGVFGGVYPEGLLAFNVFYVISTPLFVYLHRSTIKQHNQRQVNEETPTQDNGSITARLWIFPMLTIIFYMHVLIVYVAISGAIFK